jgi:hypothetical protein
MKTTWLTGCCLFLASALCYGADVGVVTILDGGARLLRGVTWYKLVEGARVQDGDLIEASERTQVQEIELAGSIVNFVGPAAPFLRHAGFPRRQAAFARAVPDAGWLKLAVKQGGIALRVRSTAGAITTGDGVAVMHVEPEALEAFVERGDTTRLTEPGKGAGEGAAHEVKGGEFGIYACERPFGTAGAAPQKFVAAMPRHFRDPLPNRAALYQVSRVQLVADRAITYAEAEPWLSGPYRRAFLKRLQPRLSDAEFRGPVMAKLQAYPEWHDILVPPEPKDKAEAPPKSTEKADPARNWPFGNTKK